MTSNPFASDPNPYQAPALSAQKSFWRLTGIVVAAVLVLYAVILVLALVAGLIAAVSR